MQECENLNGSYTCNCLIGYALNPDGYTCGGIKVYKSLASFPGPLPGFQCCSHYLVYTILKFGSGPGNEASIDFGLS